MSEDNRLVLEESKAEVFKPKVFPFAHLAICLMAALESVSLIIFGHIVLALSILPLILFSGYTLRHPAYCQNHWRSFVQIGLSWLTLGVLLANGIDVIVNLALLLSATFVLLRGTRTLVLSLSLTLGVLVMPWLSASGLVSKWLIIKLFLFLCVIAGMGYLLLRQLLAVKREVVNLSRLDIVTGVGNRRSMIESLTEAVELHRRYDTISCALFLRIDDLEAHLRSGGEKSLEQLLKELVNVCQSRIRNTDQLFRYGDDSFVLLLRATPAQNAGPLIHDLDKACQAYEFTGGRNVVLDSRLVEVNATMTWEQWLAQLVNRDNEEREKGL